LVKLVSRADTDTKPVYIHHCCVMVVDMFSWTVLTTSRKLRTSWISSCLTWTITSKELPHQTWKLLRS